MNIVKILEVADAIEQSSIPDLGFNMKTFTDSASDEPDVLARSCGTVSCIAGWSIILADEEVSLFTAMQQGQRLLELTNEQAWQLFVPGWKNNVFSKQVTAVHYYNNSITPEIAVRCLRNLAITGKVDWAAAVQPNDPELPSVPEKSDAKERV